MSGFLSPLEVRKIAEGRWELTKALLYRTPEEQLIVVPAGFYTDFASIPRVFYLTTPPLGKYDCAAVLHDYLYFTQTMTRAAADAIFKQAMSDSGVGWYTRGKMWLAVRLFGGAIWESYRQQNTEAA